MSCSASLVISSRTIYPLRSTLFLSSKPTNIPSPTYNGTNGYHNGGADYFSSNPRLSQQSHLSSTRRPGSSRSNASPSNLHTTQYPPDEPEPPYGWADPASLSRVDSARPPLPPKIPSQPVNLHHMPEPVISTSTDDLYPPFPEPSGSNGAGPSMYRNDSSTSYVLPPASPPPPLANPHTDSLSCKKLFSSGKA